MIRPNKPTTLNGEHGHLWDFIAHLSDRVDKIYYVGYVILAGIIGILIKLLLD